MLKRLVFIHDQMCLALWAFLSEGRRTAAGSAAARAATLMGMAHAMYLAALSCVVWTNARRSFVLTWPLVGMGAVAYVMTVKKRIDRMTEIEMPTVESRNRMSGAMKSRWLLLVIAYGMGAFLSPFAAAAFGRSSGVAP